LVLESEFSNRILGKSLSFISEDLLPELQTLVSTEDAHIVVRFHLILLWLQDHLCPAAEFVEFGVIWDIKAFLSIAQL